MAENVIRLSAFRTLWNFLKMSVNVTYCFCEMFVRLFMLSADVALFCCCLRVHLLTILLHSGWSTWHEMAKCLSITSCFPPHPCVPFHSSDPALSAHQFGLKSKDQPVAILSVKMWSMVSTKLDLQHSLCCWQQFRLSQKAECDTERSQWLWFCQVWFSSFSTCYLELNTRKPVTNSYQIKA